MSESKLAENGRCRTTDREEAAWHEAGHAVVAGEVGLPVDLVSIRPDNESVGRVEYPPHHPPANECTLQSILNHLMVDCAGGIAEAWFKGHVDNLGTTSDVLHSVTIALTYFGDQESASHFILFAHRETERLLKLEHVWHTVGKVAEALLAREELTGSELDDIRFAAASNESL